MPLPLYLLAVAIFAMGTSEFMLAGLLPGIAADLGVPVGTAGTLGSAFAIGMVLGAPLMAVLARAWPRRTGLAGLLVVFAAAHVVGALTSSFPLLFGTRIVAALANAGFLAVALTTAATLVPPGRTGRALSVLLSGTTVATIAGVPAGSVLGTVFGWRATFWAVAAVCLPALLGLLLAIPRRSGQPAAPGGSGLRAELGCLARPRLVLVMTLGALVNAATFASFTFLGPVLTDAAGLGRLWIPVALVLFGAGSFVGVTVAGRLSDARPGLVVAVGGPLLLAGWPVAALLAGEPVALLCLVFVLGALSFAVGSTLIARVLHEAASAPTMAGSYATAALNLGAAAGPPIAAIGLAASMRPTAPLWTSGLLVLAAVVVAAAGRGVLAVGRGVRGPAAVSQGGSRSSRRR
jgi:DHA1 family chloramphenicol resistance protein-like MFS transporter